MTTKTNILCNDGATRMERVFARGHHYYDRILYDPIEGAYYDRQRDIYMNIEIPIY